MSQRKSWFLPLTFLLLFALSACGPLQDDSPGERAPLVGEVISQAQVPPAGEAPPTTAELPQGDAGRAVLLLAAHEPVSSFLADYSDWQGEARQEHEQGNIWSVELYSEAADEWLGYGLVNAKTGEIIEFFVPRELTPEEFQAGRERVEKLVFGDAEVLALLGDPELWEHETGYDRWEARWYVWFAKGLDEWAVTVEMGDGWESIEIIDPNALEEAEQEQLLRDQAIELAYEAEGVDKALDGVDDWRTYVEHQGGSQWTVSFVNDGEELFFALVDVESWQVLDSAP